MFLRNTGILLQVHSVTTLKTNINNMWLCWLKYKYCYQDQLTLSSAYKTTLTQNSLWSVHHPTLCNTHTYLFYWRTYAFNLYSLFITVTQYPTRKAWYALAMNHKVLNIIYVTVDVWLLTSIYQRYSAA